MAHGSLWAGTPGERRNEGTDSPMPNASRHGESPRPSQPSVLDWRIPVVGGLVSRLSHRAPAPAARMWDSGNSPQVEESRTTESLPHEAECPKASAQCPVTKRSCCGILGPTRPGLLVSCCANHRSHSQRSLPSLVGWLSRTPRSQTKILPSCRRQFL